MPEIVQSVIFQFDTEFNATALKKLSDELKAVDKQIEITQKRLADPAYSKTAKILETQINSLTNKKKELITESDRLQTALNKSSTAFNGMANSGGIAAKALGALKGALSVAAITAFITKSVQAAAQLEKTSKAFQAFGLSAQKAKELTEDLDQLSSTLPFEGDQILSIAQNLLKFNVATKDVLDVTKQLSAISSGAGVSLDSLSDAYGRANATGKLFGRDFLALYKNIPGLVEQISKNTGKTIDEVVKLGKQGKLSFKDFSEGIKQATSETGKYGQSLKSYQESFSGVSKQLTESVDDLLKATGKEILPGITEAFRGLLVLLKELIPAFKVLGSVIGAAFQSIGTFFKAIKDAPKNITDFFNAIEEGRVRFGGRFLIADPDPKKISDEVLKIVKDGLADFDKRIAQEFQGRDKRLSLISQLLNAGGNADKLTEEELDKLREKLRIAREKFRADQEGFNAKLLEDISKTLIEVSFGTDVDKKLAQLDRELERGLKQLTDQLNKLKTDARKANVKIDPQIELNFELYRQLYEEEIRQAKERVLRNAEPIEAVIPLKPLFEVKGEKPTLPFPEISLPDTKQTSAISKFFERLFDNFTDPKVAENLNKFAKTAIAASNTFIETELSKTDFLISETQKRLQSLLALQEGGNATQIKLEQDRLDKLTEQRQKFVERQKAIDTGQIIANNAVSASESIKAITTAFGKGGNPIVGIAASLALVATIAATVASVNAQFNSIPKFWEGAERISDKSRPTKSGRDGHLLWADGGERIIPTKFNTQIPSYVKNRDIPTLVEMGIRSGSGGMTDRNITMEQRETNRLLKANQKLLKNQTIKLKILSDSGEEVRLKRMRA